MTNAIRLCLRKPPKERVPDVGSVRMALDGVFETAAPSIATSGASTRTADVTADGRFVMISRPVTPLREIVLVQHWFEELQRLVPAN